MNEYSDIVLDALEYYDKNNESYYNFYKNIRYISIRKFRNKKNRIFLYDQNKELIIESEYELLGKYYNGAKVWLWSWADPTQSKYQNKITTNILNYGIELNPFEHILLKSQLVTSKFYINNSIQLDIQLAVSSYISKQKIIFKYRISLDYLDRLELEEEAPDLEEYYKKKESIDDLNEYYKEGENYIEYYLFLLNSEKIKL